MKVYVLFDILENNILGIFADSKLCEEKQQEYDPPASAIIIKDLLGYNDYKGFEYPINEDCKYYKPHLETIRQLVSCLYDLDGCACGGLAHIVTDDNNLDDDIQWVIEYCDREGNKDRTERGLVKLICEELLKLSMQERILVMEPYIALSCDGKCEKCDIHKGVTNQC